MKYYDVAVVGAGIVGAACALQLQQQGFSVVLIDQQPFKNNIQELPETRVSAINDASLQLLRDLKVWDDLWQDRLTPILAMKIFAEGEELDFDAAEFGFSELGFIVENEVLLQALLAKFKSRAGEVFCPYQVRQLERHEGWEVELHGVDKVNVRAKLLVVAQGAQSNLREFLGVATTINFYDQKALVLNVKSTRPHRFTAYQRFLSTGPVAFLPLFKPHWSSVVWTLPTLLAEEYLKLDSSVLMAKLFEALPELGELFALTPAVAFELSALSASTYQGAGFVLVGDSAHTVHPLAGQGVNMGLQDVRALGKALGSNQGSGFFDSALVRYEHILRFRNKGWALSFTWLNRLFQLESQGIQRILGMGLRGINRFSGVKRQLIEVARGWIP